MKVIDASVAIKAVVASRDEAAAARLALRSDSFAAPDLITLEIASSLRRFEATGDLTAIEAVEALEHARQLPIDSYPTGALVPRVWALRHNLTPYDACYVALAEALDCPLLTSDARVARAPGVQCEVELV